MVQNRDLRASINALFGYSSKFKLNLEEYITLLSVGKPRTVTGERRGGEGGNVLDTRDGKVWYQAANYRFRRTYKHVEQGQHGSHHNASFALRGYSQAILAKHRLSSADDRIRLAAGKVAATAHGQLMNGKDTDFLVTDWQQPRFSSTRTPRPGYFTVKLLDTNGSTWGMNTRVQQYLDSIINFEIVDSPRNKYDNDLIGLPCRSTSPPRATLATPTTRKAADLQAGQDRSARSGTSDSVDCKEQKTFCAKQLRRGSCRIRTSSCRDTA